MPEPLGPSRATNSPASISRSMPSRARTVVGPRWKNFATSRVVERRHSTCLNASAGRRRAARIAPAVPAIRPPRRARPNPIARIAEPDRGTERHGARCGRAGGRPEAEEIAAARGRAGGQRGPEGIDATRGDDAERRCRRSRRGCPGRETRRRSGGRPAAASTRAPSASRARARACRRREREQRGEQERSGRGDDREREAEVVREVRGVDERAADRAGDVLRARDLSLRKRRSIAASRRDVRPSSHARARRLRGRLLRELLQLRRAAGRRPRSGRRAAG